MKHFRAFSDGILLPKYGKRQWRGSRRNKKIRGFLVGVVNFGLTFGLVLLALYAALVFETVFRDESVTSLVGIASVMQVNPWDSRHELVQLLDDSVILGSLDSVSIITALVVYVQVGRRDEKLRSHYMAWSMIDTAYGKETSYARFQALQDLNSDSQSLRGLDAPGSDLRDIELPDADLQDASLNDAKLRRANLQNSKLAFADLSQAELESANLKRARFFGSKLSNTNFGGADLSGADFYQADLSKANFLGANLKRADLTGADLRDANFKRARNLTIKQIRQGMNWEKAIYDEEFHLILSPETNRDDNLRSA